MATKKTKRVPTKGKSRLDPKFEECGKMTGAEYHSHRREAFDYYHFEYKTSDLLDEVYKWMKEQEYSKEAIAAAKKVGNDGMSSAAILARCLNTGMPDYLEQHAEYWESLEGTTGQLKPASESLTHFVDIAVKNGSLILEELKEEEKVTGPVKTIQQRTLETAQSMCKGLDAEEEKLFESPETYDVKKFDAGKILRTAETKAGHARLIKDFYQGDLAELQEVLTSTDEQLREAYAHLSKKAIKNMIAFYEEIASACQMLQESQKAQRKPRAKKAKPAEKVVEKLKYMKEFAPLKLVSVDPTKILTANELWVYNTKTRKLGKYVVDDPYNTGQKLSVKGASIINFSETKSVQKTLRKPEEKLSEFKSAGKVALRKFLEDINAVDIKLTGRLNEDTILLKVL